MGRAGVQGRGFAGARGGWGVAARSSRLWWARVWPRLTCSGGNMGSTALVPPPTLPGAPRYPSMPWPPPMPPSAPHPASTPAPFHPAPSLCLCHPHCPVHQLTVPPGSPASPELQRAVVLGGSAGGVRPCRGHKGHGSASGDGMGRTPRTGPPTAISAGTNCLQPKGAVPGTRGGAVRGTWRALEESEGAVSHHTERVGGKILGG